MTPRGRYRHSRTDEKLHPPAFRRAVPVAAITVALLGAAAIMISLITSWTVVLATFGIALLLPSAALLVVWLLRTW